VFGFSVSGLSVFIPILISGSGGGFKSQVSPSSLSCLYWRPKLKASLFRFREGTPLDAHALQVLLREVPSQMAEIAVVSASASGGNGGQEEFNTLLSHLVPALPQANSGPQLGRAYVYPEFEVGCRRKSRALIGR
jgi:hypothetical protein